MTCCLFDQLLPTGCVPQPVRWRKHHWVRLLCVRCVRRPVCSLCLRKHGGGTRPQLSWSLGCQLPRGDSFNLGAGGAAQNGNSPPLSLFLSAPDAQASLTWNLCVGSVGLSSNCAVADSFCATMRQSGSSSSSWVHKSTRHQPCGKVKTQTQIDMTPAMWKSRNTNTNQHDTSRVEKLKHKHKST